MMQNKTKVIGITGGVGAGKSTVLEYLQSQYGAMVVQADQVGHLVMEPGMPCYEPVIDLFGREVLDPDGMLNRKSIAALVFADESLREKLNQIIHPAVKTYILEQIEHAVKQQAPYFVVEAALLLEDHYEQYCQELWYIYADPAVRRRRLKESRQYTDERIDQVMASQLPDEVFRQKCDFVLDNSAGIAYTREQIDKRMRTG